MQKQVSKFDISDMLPIGLTFVVLGIGIAYGLNVMGDVRDDTCTSDGGVSNGGACWTDSNHNVTYGDSPAFNASENAIDGVAKIPEKMPLIATVVVAAIIIGILVRYLLQRFG